MSDEKFEEFLKREAAAAYNRPPAAVPRDEMWRSIAAGRVRPGRPARHAFRRIAPWIGMAATLAIGVGVGRFVLPRDAADAPPALAADTPAAGAPSAPATDAGAGHVADPTAPTDAAVPRQLPRRQALARGTTLVNGGGTLDPGTPMQVASREHLVRAEALISVVASSAADAAIDSLTSRWARDMLTSTRLLLDSPAGEDPARRGLLEDLETVLVQLVQRSGAPADERALLDRSLERTQLLTRLRTSAAGISGL